METSAARSIVSTVDSTLLISMRTRDGASTTRESSLASRLRWTRRGVKSVDAAIRETCAIRKWHLHAVNVRANHVHAVVSIGLIKPERALTAFKANATRQMRQDNFWRHDYSPWAEKGSTRYLWNERSVARAIDYVLYGQGDELPGFDFE